MVKWLKEQFKHFIKEKKHEYKILKKLFKRKRQKSLVPLRDRMLYAVARTFQWLIIILIWALWIAFLVSLLLAPVALISLIVFLIIIVIIKINHLRLERLADGNIITWGGRGKGKGLIFQHLINKVGSCLGNIPFGGKMKQVHPTVYFNSISPNTALSYLHGRVTKIKKVKDWEGLPYFLDDGALVFPNYNDAEIKKLYPSITLKLPIQRHLYGSYTVINAQSIERLFKPLRELQDDGYIKALGTIGKGYIWNRLPILRRYFVIKWRFHEQLESALNNRLPFDKLGIVNEVSSPLLTTTPEALKMQYQATNGVIKDGVLWMNKKNITYDTRYYQTVFFIDEDE